MERHSPNQKIDFTLYQIIQKILHVVKWLFLPIKISPKIFKLCRIRKTVFSISIFQQLTDLIQKLDKF